MKVRFGNKSHDHSTCPNQINLAVMQKIVGHAALKLVSEYPDGSVKGYLLETHADTIARVYLKRARKLGCDIELTVTNAGKKTGYAYIDFS